MMPELSSWPVQNSGPTGVLDSREAATHIGALLVPHASAIKAKSGFRPGPGSSPGSVTASGTPDAFVHVAPFQLMIQNVRGSGLGTYITALDATKDLNILSTPADPTNPRDDLVVAQQSDIFDSDANSDFVVRHVVGTPGAVPTDPTVTGSSNHVTLARVRVNAGVTTITSANITDLRTSGHAKSLSGGLHTVALGGILPVASAAQRDALSGIYDGFAIWRSDVDRVFVYNGSDWVPLQGFEAETGVTTGDVVHAAGTHVVLASVTFTARAGARYELTYGGSYVFSAGNLALLHMRHASGGSITTSSTATPVGPHQLMPVSTAVHTPVSMSRTFVGAASGTYTAGVTCDFYSGSGNLTHAANTNSQMYVRVTAA